MAREASIDEVAGQGSEDTSTIAVASPTTTLVRGPQTERSSLRLIPVPEEVGKPAEASESRIFRVVSLNLGGRNTNPLEFELKGDSSEMAVEAMAILRNASKAMKDAQEGPLLMPLSEMEVVQDILDAIFKESIEEVQSEWQSHIQNLLRLETWAEVLSSIRSTNPHLFNAFNLCTLQLDRPSVWENPAGCRNFTNGTEYLLAWKQWYLGVDRAGSFWMEDAPRVARKRGLDVPAAFAGLLIFDVMCLSSARRSMPFHDKDDLDDITENTRDVPFKEIASFAARLPASSLKARHALAQRIAHGAHALLAQEARSFADHPAVAEDFLPPFCALDGFTAIFLRRDSFREATDITMAVATRIEECFDGGESMELQKAWRTTVSRLAAVYCECHPRLGGFRVCLVSLHASKSDCIGGFVEKLRDVLANYDADINVVGMDSNCAAKDVPALQNRFAKAGFDIGCSPKQQQVTVSKQRTAFQTQTEKVGNVDISHKDYILTWNSHRARRGRTTYAPDLRTSYGVEQETKRCVRLPTTDWPFDHCSVATSFQERLDLRDKVRCNLPFGRTCVVVTVILVILLSPLVSSNRASPYGQPGLWFHNGFIGTPRVGICETAAPCPGEWVQHGDSCYTTTPRMGFPDVQRFCKKLGGAPVTIQSDAENQLMLRSFCPTGFFCYIGLLGDFTGKSYWSSGAAVNYTQLVTTWKPFLPLWDTSSGTNYVATLLSNMPGEATGCDVRYAFPFQGEAPTFVDVAREELVPALAMVCSGVLLAQRRPSHQRLASSLLLMAFCLNSVWAAHKKLLACFVDDFHLHLSVYLFGRNMIGGGASMSAILGLWMIVRRMCVLYPSAGFKQLFWASLTIGNLYFLVAMLLTDSTVPAAFTPVIAFNLCIGSCTAIIYLVFAYRAFRRLRNTWDSLKKEATGGCSMHGTGLMAQVWAAKLHLIAVPLAVMTQAWRWANMVFYAAAFTNQDLPGRELEFIIAFATVLDAVTNDVCNHVLAVLDMDESVIRARGITNEIAERAEREVEQHRLAVRMLKAAPTSLEQLNQLAVLEGKAVAALGSEEEVSEFLILKSAVRVETARIHRLMKCVRIRAMTMQVRYQFLVDIPALEGIPRQRVPQEFARLDKSQANADRYFTWLYGEANGAQQVLFQQVQNLLAKFNAAVWPSDLGLVAEEFPWRIWAGSKDHSIGMKRFQEGEEICPGSVLIHSPPRASCLAPDPSSLCIALEEVLSDRALIHRSGVESREEVPRGDLQSCNGGAVFIPGPQKRKQRSLDKIAADYGDSADWPAAASLVDICRCMILCDDPYAVAVFVAYLRRSVEVVRVKNRFSEDILEPRAAEELQSMFYDASASDAASSYTPLGSSGHKNHSSQQYRDISMNCVIRTPSGVPFVCEVQVTLSNLAILKHADQKLYSIRRMKSPAELSGVRTFITEGKDNNLREL